MKSDNAIGILDSGVGGLSVFRELIKILPHEPVIYFGDSKNCPYGKREIDQIKILTSKIIRFFIGKKCKLIVIACNTITGSLIDVFRKEFQLPFIGVEPATKVAVKNTKTGQIGILATASTFKSPLFNLTRSKYIKDKNIYIQVAHDLVELVEQGKINDPKTLTLLKKYLKPLLKRNVDQIVLGCTHYPFLKNAIRKIVGEDIVIIDPSLAVARQVKRILLNNNLLKVSSSIPPHSFYTSAIQFPLKKLLPDLIIPNLTVTKNFLL